MADHSPHPTPPDEAIPDGDPSAAGAEDADASSPPAAREAPASPGPRRRDTAALVIALLALIAALAAAAAGGYLWWLQQRLAQDLQQQQGTLAQHQSTLARQQEAIAQADQRLQDALTAGLEPQRAALADVEARQDTLASAMEQLRSLVGRERNDWVLAEVEYLLRIANRRLQLQQDSGTAIAALGFADRRLRELGDPGLQPVRVLIAREIDQLRATALPDVDGLAARLASLSSQVDRLTVIGARPEERTRPPAAPGEVTPASDWGEALDRAGEALQRLVVVRRHDQRVEPLLDAQQEFAAREGLRLQIEAARLALLAQDGELYRGSLAAAGDWLGRYFDREDPTQRAMVAALEELVEAPVRAEFPDVSESLRRLRAIIEQRERGARAADGTAAPGATAADGPQ